MPWVFIMWKKMKSCQSTSLVQVCQMTSAAEENLVPKPHANRSQTVGYAMMSALIPHPLFDGLQCVNARYVPPPFSYLPMQDFWVCFDFICGKCVLNNKHTSSREVYFKGDFLRKLPLSLLSFCIMVRHQLLNQFRYFPKGFN